MNVFVWRLSGKEKKLREITLIICEEEDKCLAIAIQKRTDENLLKLDSFRGALPCSDVIFS